MKIRLTRGRGYALFLTPTEAVLSLAKPQAHTESSAPSSPEAGGGNAYVTGFTVSPDFPTVNAVQPAFGGGNADAFVAKLNRNGTQLLYSTYLGGSGEGGGAGIAVDNRGNAYVMGSTESIDFPTVNAVQPASGGRLDAFVAKLDPSGSQLLYSIVSSGE